MKIYDVAIQAKSEPRILKFATISNINMVDARTFEASVVIEPCILGRFNHLTSSDKPRNVMKIF